MAARGGKVKTRASLASPCMPEVAIQMGREYALQRDVLSSRQSSWPQLVPLSMETAGVMAEAHTCLLEPGKHSTELSYYFVRML